MKQIYKAQLDSSPIKFNTMAAHKNTLLTKPTAHMSHLKTLSFTLEYTTRILPA